MLIGLALIWAIFQSQNDRFLTAVNLTNLMLQITAVGLISVGVVYVLLLGEIDLSVGAVSGLAAACMAVLNAKHGWDPYLAIAAGVLVGTAIGVVQGSLSTGFGIPSFVVTLAGLLIWQGALLYVLGDTGTVNIDDSKITGPRQHLLFGHDRVGDGDRCDRGVQRGDLVGLAPAGPGRALRHRPGRAHGSHRDRCGSRDRGGRDPRLRPRASRWRS